MGLETFTTSSQRKNASRKEISFRLKLALYKGY